MNDKTLKLLFAVCIDHERSQNFKQNSKFFQILRDLSKKYFSRTNFFLTSYFLNIKYVGIKIACDGHGLSAHCPKRMILKNTKSQIQNKVKN